jgi:hypothetical protein
MNHVDGGAGDDRIDGGHGNDWPASATLAADPFPRSPLIRDKKAAPAFRGGSR